MILTLQDTNLLLRGSQPSHPQHQEALNAQEELRQRGDKLCLVAQNLVEFRAVATRPLSVNGLGMSQSQADMEIARLEYLFPVFPDTPEIFTEWKRLNRLYGAQGKQNHDARIVAAMIVCDIPRILTFNKEDFIRYPEIVALTPKEVLHGFSLP